MNSSFEFIWVSDVSRLFEKQVFLTYDHSKIQKLPNNKLLYFFIDIATSIAPEHPNTSLLL